MSSFGRTESPVVEQSFRKKRQWRSSKRAVYWACLNLILALFMYSEIAFGSMAQYFNIDHSVIKLVEYVLAFILTVNIFVDLLRYLQPRLSGTAIEITPLQQKLLGIKDTDPGFRVSPIKPATPGQTENSLIFNTSGLSNKSNLSSRSGSPSPTRLSPSGYNVRYSPFTYQSPSASFSNLQPVPHNQTLSGYSPQMSPSSPMERLDRTGVRSRHTSPMHRSPGTISSNDQITNIDSLHHYMKDQEEKNYKSQLSTLENSANTSTSFWNYSRTVNDYSHVLRKYQYQVASRSPQSLSSRSPDDPDQGIPYSVMEVFGKFGITEDDLTLWIENLRRWICMTVVSRLVSQIDDINNILRRIGCEDLQIGEVSVSTLKRLALTKSQYVPTLNTVVPYLDVSSNQEYVVRRLKHLSQGGCMSDYDWNGGGNYGKPWGEHVPTDASLIVHMLCTYLDSRLPADPKFPDGKTFTNQHFMKTPDKPNLRVNDAILLYQSKINPPHFNVIIAEDTWNLPKGRNNLFYAILLFLYHIKTKEHGMLGRINLGLSGVNILWILETYKPVAKATVSQ